MPKTVNVPRPADGEVLYDVEEKVFEDIRANPGEQAFVFIHSVPYEGSVALVNLLTATRLGPVADRLAGEISTGQGRLVELARALARRPRILLLDEPSSGLDVKESEAFGHLLTDLLAQRGIGILMIEHDMSLVLKICDPIYVLDFGKPLMTGTPAEVRNSELVRDAYLGKEAVPAG